MLCVLFEKERSKETIIAATVVREEAEAATATIVVMATGVRAHDARIIVAIVRAHHRASTPSTVIVAIVRAAATATVAAAAISTAHDDAVVAAIVRCDGREEASTDRPEQTTGRACGRVANHALLLLRRSTVPLRRRGPTIRLLLLLLLMRRVGRLRRSSVRLLLLLLLLLLLRVGRLLGVGCCADLLRRRGSRYCGQPHLERLTRRNALRDR